MSALLFLNDEHFKITDDKVLDINIKGIILVLFYSNQIIYKITQIINYFMIKKRINN